MPVANVSDIVGKRDLVAEAQGWKDLRLKEKELAMRQAASDKKNKPKPYNFDIAEFGTDNENMFELQQNLNDQAYNYAMANSSLLSIDPMSEDCGPDCKNAHRALNNIQQSSQMFNKYGDDLKTRYNTLAELIQKDPKNYDNQENRQKLTDMENVWKMGMGGENYSFGFDSRGKLIVNSKSKKQTEKFETDANTGEVILDSNGKPKILYDDGRNGETSDKSKAKIGEDGNPIAIMVPMDTGQDTDFDVSQMNFGSWLGNLGFNEPNKNYDSESFNETVEDYSKMVYRGKAGIGVSDEDSFSQFEKTSKEALQGYIFGTSGYWDDESGTGSISGHSEYLKTLIKQDKGDTHIITKQDIIDKAYELGRFGQQEDGSDDAASQYPFDFNEKNIKSTTYSESVVWNPDTNEFEGTAPKDQDGVEQNYAFVGGGFNKPLVALEIILRPENLTLTSGDVNFSQINSKNALSQYDNLKDFKAVEYGVALFYNGRAITQEAFANLDDKEKAKASWERALFGRVNIGGSQNKAELDNLGIQHMQSADGLYVNGIILASRHESTIASIGDSKGTGDSNNNKMIAKAKAEAKRLNEELKAKYSGDNNNDNTNDPLGIL